MNWFKKAQQGLLFYPFQSPQKETIRTRPVGVDPESNQNIYKCRACGENILENDISLWVKNRQTDNANYDDFTSTSYQMPKYDKNRIYQAFNEVSQYLRPFYDQLQVFIKEKNINKDDGWTWKSDLRGWEVQIPQMQNIFTKYPEISDICAFHNSGNYWGNSYSICMLSNISEISGKNLEDISDMINNPQKMADDFLGLTEDRTPVSDQEFSIDYTYPVCEECFEKMDKCEFCQTAMLPHERKFEMISGLGGYGCEACLEKGNFDLCSKCGKGDSQDDMHYNEHRGENLCSNCYKGESEEYISWAQKEISQLNIPVGKNLPLSEKILNNLYQFLNLYIQKYNKGSPKENVWSKVFYLAEKSKLSQEAIEYLKIEIGNNDSISVKQMMDTVSDNIKAQKYMKERYPNIKTFQDVPFDIDVVPNYNEDVAGFTLTITPSDRFFAYAKKKYPDIKKIWDTMSDTPHHDGVLAYARCGYDGQNIVINNLQRDSDFDNWQQKSYRYNHDEKAIYEEAARWIDNVTKNWNVFFLDVVKAMAIKSNTNAFLTTFDQQKEKWGRLPIHKSKRTYQEVPESMGFPKVSPESDVESLMESGRGRSNSDLYQVANLYGNWYKKANSFKDRLGLCYELSGRYVLHNENATLVHGTVTNQIDKTKLTNHAWAEEDDSVFDPVWDRRMPKEDYYEVLGANSIKRYTHEQTCLNMARNRHWGPW